MMLAISNSRRGESVTAACIASGLPATTALRRLVQLEDAGLIERRPDEHDQRRHFVHLTAVGHDRLELWLAAIAQLSVAGARRTFG